MENLIKSASQPFCPLCGKSGNPVLLHGVADKLYGVKGVWNIDRCDHCGLLYLNPMPLQEEIGKAYASYYTHTEEKAAILSFLRPFEQAYVDVKYGYGKQQSLLDYLKYFLICCFPTEKAEIDIRYFYLDGRHKGRLLDVGCGSGDMMSRLRQKGWEVEGCDFDEGAVAHCRKLGIEAEVGDIFAGKYDDCSFCVVTLNHVIEHLYETEAVLRECFRILKPGGRLIMATPNGQSRLFKRFGNCWLSLHTPAHTRIFNVRNLSEAVLNSGFKIEKACTTCRNEHWVYAVSSMIRKNGHFSVGKEKISPKLMLKGKWAQFCTWILLLFKPCSGAEVMIKAIKPL